jgi:hypothetical protein
MEVVSTCFNALFRICHKGPSKITELLSVCVRARAGNITVKFRVYVLSFS